MSDEPDDPFVDLLPSDLNPARKVNNRKAKKIPRKLLHHNNLSFLRRYVTPSGQIMNRVQSRLGAKEQRKVAKLVKRARHLGLIPFVGQWKVTNHGNIYEKDIMEDREWEKELKQRGLEIRRRQKVESNESET
jgi:small subunit ribosomal protein S18